MNEGILSVTTVSAGNDTLGQQNITQNKNSFITQLKHRYFDKIEIF